MLVFTRPECAACGACVPRLRGAGDGAGSKPAGKLRLNGAMASYCRQAERGADVAELRNEEGREGTGQKKEKKPRNPCAIQEAKRDRSKTGSKRNDSGRL